MTVDRTAGAGASEPGAEQSAAKAAHGMSAVEPTVDEVARVDVWRKEQGRIAAKRAQEQAKRRVCSIHGPRPTGRMLYGSAPYGYGPVCKFCRREWSRRNGGSRWVSEEQFRLRRRAEREAMVAEVESMPPAEFYAAWEALRAELHEATRPYHREAKPDEFGVNHFGSATPKGERYAAMRRRVRRERREFEEAHDAL